MGGLERLVCGCFGTVAYSSLPKDRHGLSDVGLGEARRDARYYAISNGVRLVFMLVLGYALRNSQPAILVLVAAGAFAHGLLFVVESYRYSVLMGFSFEGNPEPPSSRLPRPTIHPYFGPFEWEPVWLYERVGIAFARSFFHWYRGLARDERSPRLGPQTAKTVNRNAATETIMQARQSEVVHLVGLLFDSALLYATLHVPGYWWILPGVEVYMNFELVVLQRHHRARLRRLHVLPAGRKRAVEPSAEGL